jgi:hypothetical protein
MKVCFPFQFISLAESLRFTTVNNLEVKYVLFLIHNIGIFKSIIVAKYVRKNYLALSSRVIY